MRIWIYLASFLGLASPPALANMIQGGGGGGPPPPGITHVQENITQGSSLVFSVSTAFLSNTTAGTLLTAEVVSFRGDPIASVTASNGTTCILSPGATDVVPNRVGIYYCQNNIGGACTITANFGGAGGGFPFLIIQEWAGALTSGADAGLGNNTAGGTLSAVTASLTSNENNQLVISVVAPNVNPSSLGAGQINLGGSGSGINVASYTLLSSSGSSVTHTYNFSPPLTSSGNEAITAFKY